MEVQSETGRPLAGDKNERFAAAKVLQAIVQLYAPVAAGAIAGAASVTSSTRRAADQYLTEFQRSDLSVPVAMKLIASQGTAGQLPSEAVLLLASTVRRRMERSSLPAEVIEAKRTLQLAIALQELHGRASEQLVLAAVAQWLHSGEVPAEALLAEASAGSGSGAAPAVTVALMALAALPEEAISRDLKINPAAREQIVTALSAAAPRMLSELGSGTLSQYSAAVRMNMAKQWCNSCKLSEEACAVLAASPLLPLAGETLAKAMPEAALAAELLEALLEKSGALEPCPEALAYALLQVLASAQPAGSRERGLLCNLVATAVDAWRRLFVHGGAGATPPAAWVSLLEALVACSSWGHRAASATLPTWLKLKDHAAQVGASETYAPVLQSASRALRAAAAFPADYAALSAEVRDEIIEYRRELRDALRSLTSESAVRRAFIDELRADIASRLHGCWEPLEEAIHALSTPAKAICDTADKDECGSATAAVVLDVLHGLASDSSPVLGQSCHRQLACTFLMCASVYTPIFRATPGSLTARVLHLARASLAVRERPPATAGSDGAFPFTVKQDHIGVVCLLKLCTVCPHTSAFNSKETAQNLCSDLRNHVSAALTGGAASTLEEHSTIVLAQAIGSAAAHSAEFTHDALAMCLSLLHAGNEGGSAVALHAAAEIVAASGALQQEAVSAALASAWQRLSENHLEATALGRFLSVIAEHAPANALDPLAQLLARLFENRREARPPLLGAATSLVHRAGREQACLALVAELVAGLSSLAWAELDCQGQASARILLVLDSEVRLPMNMTESATGSPGMVSPSDRALIEAWAKFIHEAGKSTPAVLTSGPGSSGLALAYRAAASLLAAPSQDPPTRSLALLAQDWKSSAPLCDQVRIVLEGLALADKPWAFGAVVLRAVMKALLGQMPADALGVLVPAARAVFQHGPALGEAWAREAVSGEDFPSSTMKQESKERAVKEFVSTHGDAQKFKQALKKFCGGKKKGA